MTDPTSSLFRVVGMLISLMLSLAFSKVLGELKAIRIAKAGRLGCVGFEASHPSSR